MKLKKSAIKALRWTERLTKTDMLYVVRGSFWIVMGKIGVFVVSLATMYAFANWIPKETYGTYQFILGVIGIFTILTIPGVTTALVKSVARGKEGSLKTAVVTRMRWGTLGSLGLLIASVWYLAQGNQPLGISFLIASLALPFYTSFETYPSFWTGRKDFKRRSLYMTLSVMLSALVLIPVIYFSDNLIVIVATFFSARILFDGIFIFLSLRKRKNDEIDSEMIPFGKTLTLVHSISTISNHIDKVISWKLLGPIAVANYSLAQLPLVKINELAAINILALPKLSEKKIDEERKRGVFSKFIKLFAFTVPFAVVIALIAPYLYNLLFPQYLDSVVYFQALTIVVAIMPFTLLYSALLAESKKKALYTIQTTAPALKITGFLTLTPIYGIWGMIFAIIGAEIIKGLITLHFFKKI